MKNKLHCYIYTRNKYSMSKMKTNYQFYKTDLLSLIAQFHKTDILSLIAEFYKTDILSLIAQYLLSCSSSTPR